MHNLALLQQLTAKQLTLVLSTNPRKSRFLSRREEAAGVNPTIGAYHLIDLYYAAKIPFSVINQLLLSWAKSYEAKGALAKEFTAEFYRCYDKRSKTNYARKHAIRSGLFDLIKLYQKEFPDKFHWTHLAMTGDVAMSAEKRMLYQAIECYREILKLPFENADKIEIIARSKAHAHARATRSIERLICHILDTLKEEQDLTILTMCLDTLARGLTEQEEQTLQDRLYEHFVYGTAYVQNEKNLLYIDVYCSAAQKQRILNGYAKRGDEYRVREYAKRFNLSVTANHYLLLHRYQMYLFNIKDNHLLTFLDKAIEYMRELAEHSARYEPRIPRLLALARTTAIEQETLSAASKYGMEINQPLTLVELMPFIEKNQESPVEWVRKEVAFALKMIEGLPELVKVSTLSRSDLDLILFNMRASALEHKNIQLACNISDALGIPPFILSEFSKFVEDNEWSSDSFIREQVTFAIQKMVELIDPKQEPTKELEVPSFPAA